MENVTEHVVKGTCLGPDCTQSVFTPSAEGKTARFDVKTERWSPEIDDATLVPFYSVDGVRYFVDEPDGAFPEWAIFEVPPVYEPQTQTVHHDGKKWRVLDIKTGARYWDKEGREQVVAEPGFVLPDDHTWEAPPHVEEGFAVVLEHGKWRLVEDYRGQIQYQKNDGSVSEEVTDLGPIKQGWTLKSPNSPFDVWKQNRWQYDREKERPAKAVNERHWRNGKLTSIIQRLEQYERDLRVPEAYRTGALTESDYENLLADRKALCDYPDNPDFPFGERPALRSDGKGALS
ncbi:hypothetical protein [Grimontia marina]|nr:hypothetical protein [Grimontia marina]